MQTEPPTPPTKKKTYLLAGPSSNEVDQSEVDLVFTLVCFITSNSFSQRFDPDGFRSKPSKPDPESKPDVPREVGPLLRQSSDLKVTEVHY